MQKLISKYALAAHLALTAVAPLFLSPIVVICLAGLSLVWLVMEPSCIGSETLHDARSRVSKAMFRDPVLWLSIAVAGFALIRCFNGGVARMYDAENARWFLSAPAFPMLPASADGAGLRELAMAVALIPLLQACRHALGRSARMMFVIFSSGLAGILAIVWLYFIHLGVPSLKALVDFSSLRPEYVGSVFGVYTVASAIGVFGIFENGWIRSLPLAFLGAVGCGAALFAFAPAYVTVLFVSAALLVFIGAFVSAKLKLPGTTAFRYAVLYLITLVIAYAAVLGAVDPVKFESLTEPFRTRQFFTPETLETRAKMNEVSLRMWKNHPWIGNGLGTCRSAMAFQVRPEEWGTVPPMQAAPLNGYWMMLVERGTIGAFLMLAVVFLLSWSYVVRLIKGIRFGIPHPNVWVGPVLMAVCAVEALVDISFLSPGMMIAMAAFTALSASSFPKESKRHGR